MKPDKKHLFTLSLIVLFMAGIGYLFLGHPPAPKPGQPCEIVIAGYRDLAPGPKFFFPTSLVCRTWESLVGLENKRYAPRPELAESWKMSNDGKQWTFHLRKGVVFQDGCPFDADAVIANFRRYEKSPGKTRFYRFRMNRFYPGYAGIKKKDDHTVVLYFNTPIPTLPLYMAGWGSPMFSPGCFDPDTGVFTTAPAGTGPFVQVEHKTEQYLILQRFEDYWGKKALTPVIRIRVIPDVHTRFSALRAGEIQGVIDLGGMSPVLARTLEKDSRFEVSLEKNGILHFLALNGERFPFNDPRMKMAVNLAIDKELLSREFFYGYCPPASGILSHAALFYKEQQTLYQPQRAKDLARQVTKGKTVTADLVLPSKSNYPYREMAQYLQAIMADIGVTVNIRQVETGGINNLILDGNYHMYIRCQGLPHADPVGIFEDYMQLSSSRGMHRTTQNKRFHYNYDNPGATALLDKIANTLDIQEKKTLIENLQELSSATLPVIPLVYGTTIVVHTKGLKGYGAKVYGATLTTARMEH